MCSGQNVILFAPFFCQEIFASHAGGLELCIDIYGSSMLHLRIDVHVAMGHNLWRSHFGDEHPCTAYFEVHQGFGAQGFDHHSHV